MGGFGFFLGVDNNELRNLLIEKRKDGSAALLSVPMDNKPVRSSVAVHRAPVGVEGWLTLPKDMTYRAKPPFVRANPMPQRVFVN